MLWRIDTEVLFYRPSFLELLQVETVHQHRTCGVIGPGRMMPFLFVLTYCMCLRVGSFQCFDTAGWAAERTLPVKYFSSSLSGRFSYDDLHGTKPDRVTMGTWLVK